MPRKLSNAQNNLLAIAAEEGYIRISLGAVKRTVQSLVMMGLLTTEDLDTYILTLAGLHESMNREIVWKCNWKEVA